MHLEGTVAINAAREKVWQCLTKPEAVSQCAPGVESLTIIEPDRKFQVVAAVGFGSVKVTFKTDIEWLELEAPQRARMKAHGVAPGSAADVQTEMILQPQSEGSTSLEWTADVVVLGTIASLAARLMGSVTQKLVGSFFSCVKQKIEA
jgi:carbon monoxide dehydrogenase subunit G